MKIMSVKAIDTSQVNQICSRFNDDIDGFWKASGDVHHTELLRRLACVSIFLRSKLDPQDAQVWASPHISSAIKGSRTSELRYAGKKYIKIARKLGGIGSLFWLPLDIPSSTYERYLNMDDEEAFSHLHSVGLHAPDYNDFVQRLVSTLLNDPVIKLSYFNLLVEFGDILPRSDQLLLLIFALGGSDIPVALLQSVRGSQRRWTQEGEIKTTTATEFGLPSELVQFMSDDNCLAQAGARPEITKHELEDGTPTWSIRPEVMTPFPDTLSPQTKEDLASMALRLICFACPPCFEGNTTWSPQLKKAIWVLLDKATKHMRVSLSLRTHAIEALLFFVERDFFTIRQVAVERARMLLRKSMPYYLHASLALFESIIYRMDGGLDKSDAKIRGFLSQSPHPTSHYDSALRGRLHISHIENKVQRYDSDVASCMYEWEGIQPLSSFEIEVTRRLQGTAAKFFQSIGDFPAAQASLEQHLWLNSTTPIRLNTRFLITSKLAEIYCEMNEYGKAVDILQLELEGMAETHKKGRPFRRLSLAFVEASIGQGQLDAAEATLQRLADIEPPELDDVNDQLLHMRRLIDAARTVHERLDFEEALRMWRYTLQRMEHLPIFRAKHRWTAVVIHLSIAHAQLTLGDEEGGKQSWATAVEMSRNERCEYVIPGLATLWLQKIVSAIHEKQGWPFRMMLPGGKPDITWV
ncbi:hypothetical protein BGZ61DRAFT_461791 [Ilyonectria robusta]|uniref:uncharacterized protein n=1 Tax=Ilyonectria robusta TaxID=1079257 RepID=UPI001E8E88AF|nr:uncharacterized protein BGZ61DRAFT_461791 [Ilyonectria robusta]KAH8666253.1 hypothetical protein BGZ61DRAFT_461791 [Ilyonectria robusta]